jgi:nicotinamidase-related amidase
MYEGHILGYVKKEGSSVFMYMINPNKTALLIIDAQREYFDGDRPLYTVHASEIKDNLVKLREVARLSGVRVILIRHIHDAHGSDLGRMGDFDPTPVFIEGTPGVEFIPELTVRR